MDLMEQEELAFEAREKEVQAAAAAARAVPPATTSPDGPATSVSDVAAALTSLKRTNNTASHGRSRSFRDDMAHHAAPPRTPGTASPEAHAYPQVSTPPSGFIPRTPPVSTEPRLRNLSPPPPPGRRLMGGGIMRHASREAVSTSGGQPLPDDRGVSTPPPPPPPPPPAAPGGLALRPPHPLSCISGQEYAGRGRYVPHVVSVSLDTSTPVVNAPIGEPFGAVALGYRPRLGQLLEAHPLDANKASAITCVKYSPSTDFLLIGSGVREPVPEASNNFHPVTAIYRIRGGMRHVSTMLSGDDDVNIARFHPDSGHSFIYGTKQGRVRVLSPRPWNFYY